MRGRGRGRDKKGGMNSAETYTFNVLSSRRSTNTSADIYSLDKEFNTWDLFFAWFTFLALILKRGFNYIGASLSTNPTVV